MLRLGERERESPCAFSYFLDGEGWRELSNVRSHRDFPMVEIPSDSGITWEKGRSTA